MGTQAINEIEFSYTLLGDPKNPPLVLIAGYTCDQASWKDLVTILEKYFYILTFDNQGMPGTKDLHYTPLNVMSMAKNTVALYQAPGMG